MPYKNKEDQLKAQKRYYRKNKDYYIKKARERDNNLRQWINNIKTKSGCTTCGESHVSCLEFHHRDQIDKEFNIHEAFRNGWGKKRILGEVSKCDILCANCHRKLHWENKTLGLNKMYLKTNI